MCLSFAFLAPIILLVFYPTLANLKISLALAAVAIFIFVFFSKKYSSYLELKFTLTHFAIVGLSAALLLIVDNVKAYLAFELNGIDFSIYDHALFNTTNGPFMWSNLCNCNHFAVHPNWILLGLIPLHELISSPWFLVILQPLIIVSSLIPLYLLTKSYIATPTLKLVFLVAFIANPWVGSINGYGFHVEAFYLPIGFWLLWAWISQRNISLFLFLLLFLSIKEDAAFYMLGFSFYGFLFKQRKKISASIFLISLGVFIINQFVVMPAIRPAEWQPSFVSFWGHYGNDLESIALTMLKSPWLVLKDILSSQWYLLFASALFLPFFSGHAFAAMLPAMIILGTSLNPNMRAYGLYYSAPLLPFFFWGFLQALPKLTKKLGEKKSASIFLAACTLLLFTRNGSIKLDVPRLEIYKDLRLILEEQKEFSGTICSQLSLVPHLPYHWDIRALSDECLKIPGAKRLGHLDLVTYPYNKNSLKPLLLDLKKRDSGILTDF
ncbi:MAG: DUF2079 domain-containing protein [Oligoflexales bacterium]|nr:DUF2079 domain-containing protein [Oligoflexales bacterium]